MAAIPTATAPKNEAKTTLISKFIAVNLINPPIAPIHQIGNKVRRGTLKSMAKPMAAIPAQKPLINISANTIIKCVKLFVL